MVIGQIIKLAILPLIFFFATCAICMKPKTESEQQFKEKIMKKLKELKKLGYRKCARTKPGFEGSISIFDPEVVNTLLKKKGRKQENTDVSQPQYTPQQPYPPPGQSPYYTPPQQAPYYPQNNPSVPTK